MLLALSCQFAYGADLPHRHCGLASRKLSLSETIYLATIFGNHVDYSKIRIVRQETPEPFTFAGGYTTGNRIFLSPIRYRLDYTHYRGGADFWMDDIATLIREVCHVWQSQAKVAGFSQAALLAEHKLLKLDVYKYDISDHPRLGEFRLEQQCQILFDYIYVRSFQDPTFSAYASVIRDGLNPDSILPIPGKGFRNPGLRGTR